MRTYDTVLEVLEMAVVGGSRGGDDGTSTESLNGVGEVLCQLVENRVFAED